MTDILNRLNIPIPDPPDVRLDRFVDTHRNKWLEVSQSIYLLCETLQGHAIVLVHPESTHLREEARHHTKNHRLHDGGLWFVTDLLGAANLIVRVGGNPGFLTVVTREMQRQKRDQIIMLCVMESDIVADVRVVHIPPCPCGGGE